MALALPIVPSTLLHAADRREDQREETLTKGRPTSADSLSEAIVMKHENLFLSHNLMVTCRSRTPTAWASTITIAAM